MKDNRLGKKIGNKLPKCPDCKFGYLVDIGIFEQKWECNMCGVEYAGNKDEM